MNGENGIMIEQNAIVRATTYEIDIISSKETILVMLEGNILVISDHDGNYVNLPLNSIEAVINTIKRLL